MFATAAGWLKAALAAMLIALSPAAHAGGRVETGLAMPSQVLGHAIPYAIYRPEASLAQPLSPSERERRFPVLYLLHGRGDNENAWIEHGDIAATLDRKIASGEMQPLIVIMPMAANSWYVDDVRSGPASFGPVARAFTGDLIAAIDSHYATASCRQGRAVGGLSMGGFGALGYAFDRPDLYSAAISLSGSLFSEQADDIATRKGRYGQMFGGIYGEPFDVDRFRAWTVFARLDKAGDSAKQVGVWLAAGDEDFPAILGGTARMHLELQRRGVASELRIYDGDHTWRLWSRAIDPALSWLSARLDPRCPHPPTSPTATAVQNR